MKKLALALLMVNGCYWGLGGGEEHFTWGVATKVVVNAFCDENFECGYMTEERVELCVRHNYFQQCGLYENCGRVLSEDLREPIETCAADIDALSDADDCFSLFFGLPESCGAYFDADPRK